MMQTAQPTPSTPRGQDALQNQWLFAARNKRITATLLTGETRCGVLLDFDRYTLALDTGADTFPCLVLKQGVAYLEMGSAPTRQEGRAA